MKMLTIVLSIAFAGVVASANNHGGAGHGTAAPTAPTATTPAPTAPAAAAETVAPAKKKMAKKGHAHTEEKKEEGTTK
ncbi:MAG: hypothetical protein ACK5WZ_04240 [Pseudobdellovibrionaceae bacterium]